MAMPRARPLSLLNQLATATDHDTPWEAPLTPRDAMRKAT